jgi:CheY-like chemotaxis protein
MRLAFGVGSFAALLPICSAPCGKEAGDVATGLDRRRGARDAHILVADDNRDLRHLFQTWLQFCGFVVTTAGNGDEAVRLATTRRPQLVLMDLSMPVLDGFEATRRLRSHPETATVPIVAVTASVSERDRRQAHAVGMDAFVEKPVDCASLLDTVRRFLRALPDTDSGATPGTSH